MNPHTPPPALLPPAAERLARSRERMRLALREMREPAPGTAAPREHPGFLHTLMSLPGVGPLAQALKQEWKQHPLHMATKVSLDVASAALRPVAQRHPALLVAGAMVAGALLVKLRPWRGILKPALVAGLAPQLIARAMALVPFEAWIAGLSSAMSRPSDGPAAQPARAAPDTSASNAGASNTSAPSTTAPNTDAPDKAMPDTAAPGTTAPDTLRADTPWQPDTPEPGTARPPVGPEPAGAVAPDASRLH